MAGPGLSISYEFPNNMPFKIGAALYRAGSKAVLYAPGGNGWARAVVDRLAHGLRSARYDIPPLTLVHEVRPGDEVRGSRGSSPRVVHQRIPESDQRLDGLAEPPRWLSQVRAALKSGERCHGRSRWTADELTALFERKQANHRAYASPGSGGIPVMSIHQAKNRQFEHVVLLWPPEFAGRTASKRGSSTMASHARNSAAGSSSGPRIVSTLRHLRL